MWPLPSPFRSHSCDKRKYIAQPQGTYHTYVFEVGKNSNHPSICSQTVRLLFGHVSTALLLCGAPRRWCSPGHKVQHNSMTCTATALGVALPRSSESTTLHRPAAFIDDGLICQNCTRYQPPPPPYSACARKVVVVAQVRSRRAHILKPIDGWVSMTTETGYRILESVGGPTKYKVYKAQCTWLGTCCCY